MSAFGIYALVITFLLICYYIGMISYDLFVKKKGKSDNSSETIIQGGLEEREELSEEDDEVPINVSTLEGYRPDDEKITNQAIEKNEDNSIVEPLSEKEELFHKQKEELNKETKPINKEYEGVDEVDEILNGASSLDNNSSVMGIEI